MLRISAALRISAHVGMMSFRSHAAGMSTHCLLLKRARRMAMRISAQASCLTCKSKRAKSCRDSRRCAHCKKPNPQDCAIDHSHSSESTLMFGDISQTGPYFSYMDGGLYRMLGANGWPIMLMQVRPATKYVSSARTRSMNFCLFHIGSNQRD